MVRDALLQIEQELNARHLERRDVIHGLILALIARQHVVLLGPPGAGKSMLARDVATRIGGRYFEWLLTRMSTPEELFGPISLKALEQDSYRRVIAGKLPEADVAFLDECFKASSSILNTLLSAMHERIFHNDGAPTRIPLQTLIGASNELPEDREELSALWDRFLLRFVVDWLRDPASFEGMLTSTAGAPGTTITLQELAQAQAEAAQVDIRATIPTVLELRSRALEVGLRVSDRRWHEAMSVVRAEAWVNGRSEAIDEDLAVFADVLWDDPAQRADVRKMVLSLVAPNHQEVEDILDQALDAYNAFLAADEDNRSKGAWEANARFLTLGRRLKRLIEDARERQKSAAYAEEALKQITRWQETVAAQALKMPEV